MPRDKAHRDCRHGAVTDRVLPTLPCAMRRIVCIGPCSVMRRLRRTCSLDATRLFAPAHAAPGLREVSRLPTAARISRAGDRQRARHVRRIRSRQSTRDSRARWRFHAGSRNRCCEIAVGALSRPPQGGTWVEGNTGNLSARRYGKEAPVRAPGGSMIRRGDRRVGN